MVERASAIPPVRVGRSHRPRQGSRTDENVLSTIVPRPLPGSEPHESDPVVARFARNHRLFAETPPASILASLPTNPIFRAEGRSRETLLRQHTRCPKGG